MYSGKRDSSAQKQTAQNRIRARNGLRRDRNAAATARQLRALCYAGRVSLVATLAMFMLMPAAAATRERASAQQKAAPSSFWSDRTERESWSESPDDIGELSGVGPDEGVTGTIDKLAGRPGYSCLSKRRRRYNSAIPILYHLWCTPARSETTRLWNTQSRLKRKKVM